MEFQWRMADLEQAEIPELLRNPMGAAIEQCGLQRPVL